MRTQRDVDPRSTKAGACGSGNAFAGPRWRCQHRCRYAQRRPEPKLRQHGNAMTPASVLDWTAPALNEGRSLRGRQRPGNDQVVGGSLTYDCRSTKAGACGAGNARSR